MSQQMKRISNCNTSFIGFIFIRNPFLNCGQRYWIKRCLRDFHAWPNNTNLRNHVSLAGDENLWDISQYCR